MSCKRLFQAVSIVGTAAAALLSSGESVQRDRPNIIFILADDMGFGDMGCAGHPYVKTPNLDRLAREGTMYTDFYVHSAVCAPSRTAFMTGQFPVRNNVHHIYSTPEFNRRHGTPDFLDPHSFTVADLMKEAGYITGHIGKWHLCGKSGPTPDEYGFDFWLISHDGNASSLYQERWETTEHRITQSSHWIMQDGIDFIEQHRDDENPFYLNLWTLVPHAPLNPTPEELAVYSGLQADPNDFSSWMKRYAQKAPDFSSQMKVFCASMTSLDSAIGRLLDYLDDTGLAENTLIIFSSDNGPEDYQVGPAANAGVGSSGEFRGRKRSAYLGGMRVPCIVRWPLKMPGGWISPEVWSAVDLLPTLAGIIGEPLPAQIRVDGEDLCELLAADGAGRQKPLFWEWKYEVFGNQDYLAPQLAMLEGRWWAGCNPDGSRLELFDLETDAAQTNNVKDRFPEVAARMKGALLAWKKTMPESFYEPVDAGSADDALKEKVIESSKKGLR